MMADTKKATRAAFGETLVKLVDEGLDIYAVDADLSASTTTAKLGQAHPSRLINVGIAEQNMIGVAAGLSLTGKTVFTGSFAVFGTGRVYDQIRNTVCYANLDVKIAPTHAGISVCPDGGSHQMIEDLALMRVLPQMRILVPADYPSAKAAIRIAATTPGPFYIRLGRSEVPMLYSDGEPFELGRAKVVRRGADVTIVACGVEVYLALEAAVALDLMGIDAEVIDVFSLKPLDEQTILESAQKTGFVITAEEHSVIGGLGSAVAELMGRHPGVLSKPMRAVGVQDRFGTSGEFNELFKEYGLDAQSLCNTVLQLT
jgi:transketolase